MQHPYDYDLALLKMTGLIEMPSWNGRPPRAARRDRPGPGLEPGSGRPSLGSTRPAAAQGRLERLLRNGHRHAREGRVMQRHVAFDLALQRMAGIVRRRRTGAQPPSRRRDRRARPDAASRRVAALRGDLDMIRSLTPQRPSSKVGSTTGQPGPGNGRRGAVKEVTRDAVRGLHGRRRHHRPNHRYDTERGSADPGDGRHRAQG